MADKISRRTVMLRGLQIPLGGALLFGLAGCGKSDTGNTSASTCANYDTMKESERSMRNVLKYTEHSTNPEQVCGGCDMFHPGESASACGTCDMFTGGPVNPKGHCDSWSHKV